MIQEQCPRTVFQIVTQTVHNIVHCSRWVVCTVCMHYALLEPGAVSSRAGHGRDTKIRVATCKGSSLPKPGCDTKSRSQPLGSRTRSRHQTVGRDTTSAHSGAFRSRHSSRSPVSRHEKCVATSNWLNHVATPKSVSRPNFKLPCSLRVATLKAMSRHPNGCPHHDMKIMSRPRTNLIPAPAMS